MSGELTDYGFTFGACEVTRLASLPDGSVCLRVATGSQRIEVYVSPAGRSLRAFSPGGVEWKPERQPCVPGVPPDAADGIRNASRLLHVIADRVGDRFDYVIGDAGPFREAAEALDKLVKDAAR